MTVRAARDVNLIVCRGETLGVLGESGSGKSTSHAHRTADRTERRRNPDRGRGRGETLSPPVAPASQRVQIVFQDLIGRSSAPLGGPPRSPEDR